MAAKLARRRLALQRLLDDPRRPYGPQGCPFPIHRIGDCYAAGASAARCRYGIAPLDR